MSAYRYVVKVEENTPDCSKICRTCLSTEKVKLFCSIFGIISLNGVEFQIFNLLLTCANIRIWENYDLPKYICDGCIHQIVKSYIFRLQVESADETLRHNVGILSYQDYNNNQHIGLQELEISATAASSETDVILKHHQDHEVEEVKKEKFESTTLNDELETSFSYKYCQLVNELQLEEFLPQDFELFPELPQSDNGNFDQKKNGTVWTSEASNKSYKKSKSVVRKKRIGEKAKKLPKRGKVPSSKPCDLDQNNHTELNQYNGFLKKCGFCTFIAYNEEQFINHDNMVHNSSQLGLQCNKCDTNFIDFQPAHSERKSLDLVNSTNSQVERESEAIDEIVRLDVDIGDNQDEQPSEPLILKCDGNVSLETTNQIEYLTEDEEYKTKNNQVTKTRSRLVISICLICNRGFITQQRLLEHRVQFHSKVRYKMCEICGKSFYKGTNLTGHLLLHKLQKSHHCKSCGRYVMPKLHLATYK